MKPDKRPSANTGNTETFFKDDGSIDYEIVTERNPDRSIKRVYRREPPANKVSWLDRLLGRE